MKNSFFPSLTITVLVRSLFLFSVLFSISLSSNAQETITIGTGSSYSTPRYPFYGYYDFGWSNIIYKAHEIGRPGNITRLGFHVASAPVNYTMTNQKIYARHTLSNSFTSSSYPGTNDFQLIYNGNITYNGSGWKEIVLTIPFDYNGVENLEFLFENRDGSYANGFPYFTATPNIGENRVRRDYKDYSFPQVNNNCSLVNALPNIRLTITDCPSSQLQLVATPSMVVPGGNLDLKISGFPLVGTSVQWQSSIDGFNFSNLIENRIGSFQVENLTSPTFFRGIIKKDGCYELTEKAFVAIDTNSLKKVSIGNGISKFEKYPIYGFYDFSWSSLIYKANEINATGKLSHISFYVDNAPTNVILLNQKIYARHTQLKEYSDSNYPTQEAFSLIYDGSLTFNGSGWKEINLTHLFEYNGMDNLEFLFENLDGTYSLDYPVFRGETGINEYRVKRDYKDGTFPNTCNHCNRYKNIPNIKMKFLPCSNREGNALAFQTAVPLGNPINLSINGIEQGANIQWQKSLDNTIYSNISRANAIECIDYMKAVPVYYRAVSTKGCSQYSNEVKVEPDTCFVKAIQIGDSLTSIEKYPTNLYYDYGWSNFVYKASEIGDAGNIASFSFYVSNNPKNFLAKNQKIYLKHTSVDNYTNATYPTSEGYTLVFEGDIYFNGSGWLEIPFDLLFAYNGIDNLEVLFENHQGKWSSNYPTFRYTSGGGTYRVRRDYKDGAFPSSCQSCNRYKNIPNIKIKKQYHAPYAGEDFTICSGDTVMLRANGGDAYRWTPAIGLNNPNVANPLASPLTSTSYFVTVTKNGLQCQDEVNVFVDEGCMNFTLITTELDSLTDGDSLYFHYSDIRYNYTQRAGTINQLKVFKPKEGSVEALSIQFFTPNKGEQFKLLFNLNSQKEIFNLKVAIQGQLFELPPSYSEIGLNKIKLEKTLLQVQQAPSLITSRNCTSSGNFNTVKYASYDESGKVISEKKQFMDGLGRAIQSQSRVISDNNVLAAETVFDEFGRPILQSLAAPIYTAYPNCYKENFITNLKGEKYSWKDFDKEPFILTADQSSVVHVDETKIYESESVFSKIVDLAGKNSWSLQDGAQKREINFLLDDEVTQSIGSNVNVIFTGINRISIDPELQNLQEIAAQEETEKISKTVESSLIQNEQEYESNNSSNLRINNSTISSISGPIDANPCNNFNSINCNGVNNCFEAAADYCRRFGKAVTESSYSKGFVCFKCGTGNPKDYLVKYNIKFQLFSALDPITQFPYSIMAYKLKNGKWIIQDAGELFTGFGPNSYDYTSLLMGDNIPNGAKNLELRILELQEFTVNQYNVDIKTALYNYVHELKLRLTSNVRFIHDKPVPPGSSHVTSVNGGTNNPIFVSNTAKGTLGWYYSNSNNEENYVASDRLPYSRVEYYPDPLGRPKRSSGVGLSHKLGSGHENKVFYLHGGSEAAYVLGGKFYGKNLSKTATIDSDGNVAVSFKDENGLTLASCLSGKNSGCIKQLVIEKLQYINGLGKADIHIPSSSKDKVFLPVKASRNIPEDLSHLRYKLFNLDTYLPLNEGHDFTIERVGTRRQKINFLRNYATGSHFIRIEFEYTPEYINTVKNQYTSSFEFMLPFQEVEYETDYGFWTIYEYNEKAQLVNTISPEGINCEEYNPSIASSNVQNSKDISPNKVQCIRKDADGNCLTYDRVFAFDQEIVAHAGITPQNEQVDHKLEFKLEVNSINFNKQISDFECNGIQFEPNPSPSSPNGSSFEEPWQAEELQFLKIDEKSLNFYEYANQIAEETLMNASRVGAIKSYFDSKVEECVMSRCPDYEQLSIEEKQECYKHCEVREYFNQNLLNPVTQLVASQNLSCKCDTVLNLKLTRTKNIKKILSNGFVSITPYTYQINSIEDFYRIIYLDSIKKQEFDSIAILNGHPSTDSIVQKDIIDYYRSYGYVYFLQKYFPNLYPLAKTYVERTYCRANCGYGPCPPCSDFGCDTDEKKLYARYKINTEILGKKEDGTLEKIAVDNSVIKINLLQGKEMDNAGNCNCTVSWDMNSIEAPSGIVPNSLLDIYKEIIIKYTDAEVAEGNSNEYFLYNPSLVRHNYLKYLFFNFETNYLRYPEMGIRPKHTMPNINEYNLEGNLIQSTSPDEGITQMVYDKEGKPRFSQNSEQRKSGRFSYIVYDRVGRLVEKGEYNPNLTPVSGQKNLYFEKNFGELQVSNGKSIWNVRENIYKEGLIDSDGLSNHNCTMDVFIKYDQPDYAFLNLGLPSSYKQQYMAGNISRSGNENNTTWYSYDMYGRIKWSVQKNLLNNKITTLEYSYDLLGNVLEVIYQRGLSSERFHHHFTYDADLRLKEVETSRDGATKSLQAKYIYYQHGALKRVELADKLQGTDYVYTIQGWLKSINNPMADKSDPGKDGLFGTENAMFKPDVFGMTLDYFTGDYNRNGAGIYTLNASNQKNHYNGLVKDMRWQTKVSGNIDDLRNYNNQQLCYSYQYDELNRLTESMFGSIQLIQTNSGTSISNGEVVNYYDNIPITTLSFAPTEDYKEFGIAYSKNGNITSLNRNGHTTQGLSMDRLNYEYFPSTNKLKKISDAASLNYGTDLKNHLQDENYAYDAIGQMLADKEDGNYSTYNSNGKVTGVYSDETKTKLKIKLYYDERGQRILKESYQVDGVSLSKKFWYIRDANGKVMSEIEEDINNQVSTITEQAYPIYAANRLGVYKINGTNYSTIYEISDHLGNVRATINRNLDATGNVQVMSYADYYAHGMQLPGQCNSSNSYNRDYQGITKDPETGYNAFDLRNWDARIGRWTSPDPMGQHFSPYLGMSNNPVSFIDPTGGQDEEPNQENETKWTYNHLWMLSGYDGNIDDYLVDVHGAERLTKEEHEYLYGQGDGITKPFNLKPVRFEDVLTDGWKQTNDHLRSLERADIERSLAYDQLSFSQKFGMFDLGLKMGVQKGVDNTVDFFKSLGTAKGWEDLGQGVVDMAHITQGTPRGMVLKYIMLHQVSTYVQNIPNMTAFEYGYDLGYASEKVAEAYITGMTIPVPKSLLGLKTGLGGSSFTTISSVELRGAFGKFAKQKPTPLTLGGTKDIGTFIERNFVVPPGRIIGFGQLQYIQN